MSVTLLKKPIEVTTNLLTLIDDPTTATLKILNYINNTNEYIFIDYASFVFEYDKDGGEDKSLYYKALHAHARQILKNKTQEKSNTDQKLRYTLFKDMNKTYHLIFLNTLADNEYSPVDNIVHALHKFIKQAQYSPTFNKYYQNLSLEILQAVIGLCLKIDWLDNFSFLPEHIIKANLIINGDILYWIRYTDKESEENEENTAPRLTFIKPTCFITNDGQISIKAKTSAYEFHYGTDDFNSRAITNDHVTSFIMGSKSLANPLNTTVTQSKEKDSYWRCLEDFNREKGGGFIPCDARDKDSHYDYFETAKDTFTQSPKKSRLFYELYFYLQLKNLLQNSGVEYHIDEFKPNGFTQDFAIPTMNVLPKLTIIDGMLDFGIREKTYELWVNPSEIKQSVLNKLTPLERQEKLESYRIKCEQGNEIRKQFGKNPEILKLKQVYLDGIAQFFNTIYSEVLIVNTSDIDLTNLTTNSDYLFIQDRKPYRLSKPYWITSHDKTILYLIENFGEKWYLSPELGINGKHFFSEEYRGLIEKKIVAPVKRFNEVTTIIDSLPIEKPFIGDVYSYLKAKQLQAILANAPTVAIQGLHVDLDNLRKNMVITPNNPIIIDYTDNPKLLKIQYELQLKHVINHNSTITLINQKTRKSLFQDIECELKGYYVKKHTIGKFKKIFITRLTFAISQGCISITNRHIYTSKEELVKYEPAFKNFTGKLYNESFYLANDKTKERITVFNNNSVGRTLSRYPDEFFALLSQADTSVNKKGQPTKALPKTQVFLGRFLPLIIGKSNVTIESATGIDYAIYDSLYVEDNDIEGLRLYLVPKNPMNTKVSHATLINKLIISDYDNNPLIASKHELTRIYLETLLYNYVIVNNASTTTLFEKITRLVFEN